uniref:ABC transmembrane type-1 domain-containing protein n=1 Tax=Compsopogon caeruleus TaxID=31354 RepID=A0A7S1TAP9_9RHOD|mmetsp:Transcript_15021/g.30531  ORF Transcript_15021/g.30531 Transcript_15021/m.30531 type:complete len:205 (+) Transcript_15021:493-1107(+)
MIALVVLGWMYHRLGSIFLDGSRELKRLTALTMSPILVHFEEAMDGFQVIRAFDVQSSFVEDNRRRIKAHMKPTVLGLAASRWLGVRLGILGNALVLVTGLSVTLGYGYISAGYAGLSITWALQIGEILAWMVATTTKTETMMSSVERVTEFTKLPTEGFAEEQSAPSSWPDHGTIHFEDVVLAYRSDQEPVLKQVSFSVAAGE